MEALVTILFMALVAASLVFIFLGGFGNLLILIFSFAYFLITGFEIIPVKVLISLAIIYLTGELFEYVFIILGVKISGAGKRAIWGAIIGGLVGSAVSLAFLGAGFILLTAAGIFLGAFFTELADKKNIAKALKAGLGSFLGRFGALVFKVVLGILMVIIITSHILSYLNII
ncbi:MAG: DUF456 domain-containing protein [Candidatus Omnitrophica bacterium]|nr:DUF456 domain-containing protein [Candidatus Omnitrophota bacterium]